MTSVTGSAAPACRAPIPRWPVRRRRGDNALVPSWGSFSYAFGPLVAVGVLALLALLLRWTFSRGQSVVAGPARAGTPLEYGLLVPVAEPADRAQAEQQAGRLRAAGVRATVTETTEGLRVMVWTSDYARAQHLLAGQE